MMQNSLFLLALLVLSTIVSIPSRAQDRGYRPGLALREDWKEIPAEIPVSQAHVNHPDLLLELHGPGQDSIKKSHHEKPADDPYYIWSGICTGNWAVTLKHREKELDLSGYARIRWRTKQSGFRQLHLLLQLADGTWLVSVQSEGYSGDWKVGELIMADMEWFTLDIQAVTEQKPVRDPDLGRVRAIGFTDLMPGGNSDACSRLDWIEVYGYLVERNNLEIK